MSIPLYSNIYNVKHITTNHLSSNTYFWHGPSRHPLLEMDTFSVCHWDAVGSLPEQMCVLVRAISNCN